MKGGTWKPASEVDWSAWNKYLDAKALISPSNRSLLESQLEEEHLAEAEEGGGGFVEVDEETDDKEEEEQEEPDTWETNPIEEEKEELIVRSLVVF